MHILFVTPVVPSPSYGRRPYNFIRFLCRSHQVYLTAFLTHEYDDMVALRQLAEWGVIIRTVPHPKWRGILNCAKGLARPEPLRVKWIRSSALDKAPSGNSANSIPSKSRTLIECEWGILLKTSPPSLVSLILRMH